MTKIISLAERTKDGTRWTVEDMLEDALNDIRAGRRLCNKAIVVFLDNTGDAYGISYAQAGMKCSEIVALLDIAKTDIKRDMGF
jgi:hypothetical protein